MVEAGESLRLGEKVVILEVEGVRSSDFWDCLFSTCMYITTQDTYTHIYTTQKIACHEINVYVTFFKCYSFIFLKKINIKTFYFLYHIIFCLLLFK
jgi:hypothetical protein